MMIESIEKVEKNEKVFFKVKAGGKSFTAFDSAKAFNQLSKKEFKQGDEVSLDFTTSPGTFKGKPIEYRNLVKIIMVKAGVPGEPIPSKSEVEKVDWEGKERRMIRMNCLKHAGTYFEVNKDRMAKEFPDGMIPAQTFINIAKEFEEKYIYFKLEADVDE